MAPPWPLRSLLCKACCLSLVMQRNHCEPILCEVRATPLNLLFRPVLRGPRPWPIRGPQKTDPQIKNKNRGGLRIARKDPSRRGGIDGPNFRPNGPTRTRNGPKTSKKLKNPPKTRGAAPKLLSAYAGLYVTLYSRCSKAQRRFCFVSCVCVCVFEVFLG